MTEKNRIARTKAIIVAVMLVGLMAVAFLSTASADTNSWTEVNTNLLNKSVKSLAISPLYATDNTLFAGTGTGVFKSTNGGQSWGGTSLTSGTVRALALSPNFGTAGTETVAFAGTDSGVFESTDTGMNWSESIATIGGTNAFAVSPKLQPGKD
ncbi:MAG: WD40/YVTN/BNR-like repeat-containing protein [Candidatus Aquicultor sp.]